jgi:hypothetical protein
MAASVTQTVGAVVPPGTPHRGGDTGAIGHRFVAAEPKIPVELGGGRHRIFDDAVEIEVGSIIGRIDPDMGFDRCTAAGEAMR